MLVPKIGTDRVFFNSKGRKRSRSRGRGGRVTDSSGKIIPCDDDRYFITSFRA